MDAEEQNQDIVVQIAKNFDNLDINITKLKKLVRAICHRFKLPKATVSIAIVGNSEIRKLNNRFLNHNCATDCLSFDLSDSDDDFNTSKLFELIVNAEKAVEEANLRGHSSEAELALYVTHGLLHNFGYDDTEQGKAKEMHDTEDEILQQLGYSSVYNRNSK